MDRTLVLTIRLGWPACLLGSGLATAAALGLMFLARAMFQIRTLPERVMEWLLLFVPLDAFEKGVQTFGPQAKEYALIAATGVLAAILFGLGVLALRRAWPGGLVLALGPLLWLFAMGVVMPLTGAGYFATELFQNVALINALYLGLALAYASLLLAARLVAEGGAAAAPAGRRPLLIGLAGLAGSYAAGAWFARQGAASTSSLPLATIAPPTPAPVPTVAAAPAAPAPQAEARPSPGPTVAAPPTAVPTPGLPVPAPARELARDKDGSLTAAGRKPGELPSLLTANRDFYVVTKNAGGDPRIAPESWRCVVDGEVNRPIQLDYRTLRQLPSVEQVKTLECISNFTAMCELTSFGCDLISTASWRGVRLRDVFELAGGLKASAVALAVLSADEFTSAVPVEAALDPDTILAYEMNGEVLPYEHGYPARLLTPGRYGFKSAKWVAALRPMSRQFADWYGQRNWNREGVVKTMTRIDQPAGGATLAAGRQRIAGIAYAGNRGVKLVELSLDGGQSWRPAGLIEPPAGPDAWVRWQVDLDLPPGGPLKLVARTTDGTGEPQTETFSLPQPDGGSGRHSLEVTVRG